MLTYKYTAREISTGKKVKSEVQADNEHIAARLLKEQGLAPLDIQPLTYQKNSFSKLTHRIKTKDKVLFSRQLSTLINAGLPLVQSLRHVSGQTSNKHLKAIIDSVITDVEAGQALSVSMQQYPEAFNQVYTSLVAAGETSGTLDRSLERLANQQEKDADIISKVRGAMVYPIIVLAVMFLVLSFMMIKVVPQVKVMYEGMQGATLPLITRILISVSDFAIRFWWVIVLIIVVSTFFIIRWGKTAQGKRTLDGLKMRAWPIGRLYMKMYMARFARTGSTLVASGIPLIQMLEITANSVNNVHITESLKIATEKVKSGKSLSEAITGDPNFLELVPNMLHIGEQSGSTEEMLSKIADYYERELDNEIKAISTLIEPVIMVLLGIIALIIVIAVLLPIYNLAGQIIR